MWYRKANRCPIQSLKAELRKVRAEVRDTDEDNARIREIVYPHWDD